MDKIQNKNNFLDDSWLKEIDEINKLYQDFYLDDVYYTNLHFIYINKSNEIEKIKEEMLLMKSPNCISREEIIGILKNNMIENNIRYTLLNILKCNVSLNPEEIEIFMKTDDFSEYTDKFITSVRHIDTLMFERTINMFQDLNDIFFILCEKSNVEININTNTNKNSYTKKVFLKNKNKKTHRRI
jgi:hypothetical protein